MSGLKGGLPEPGATIYRFHTPAIPSVRQPGEPARPEPGHGAAPVPSPSQHGSAVLAGLPALPAFVGVRAKGASPSRQKPTGGGAAAGAGHAHAADAHETRELGENWKFFHFSGRSASGQQSSGDDSAHSSAAKGGAMPSGSFLHGADRAAPLPPSRMAAHALVLPALCKAEMAARGPGAMRKFLSEIMHGLVVDFVKDIAARIKHRALMGGLGRSSDATLPIREATDEFLNLMRPLYRQYVDTPSLYGNARDVLCGAQALLQQELQPWGGQGGLSREMKDSLCFLLPVVVMGCMPKPRAGARGGADTVRELTA